MKLVRRDFLQLASVMVMASATPKEAEAAAGPSFTEILRRDLVGQNEKVTETLVTVVAFPPGADGVHDLPRGFHFVAADEECGVAGNSFQQQPFVGFRRVGTEFSIIAEVHPHRPQADVCAGNLAVEP